MKNEGLMTIVVIDGYFIEHEREKVEELLHLVAKALGTGLTSKSVDDRGWHEYSIEPAKYQREAQNELNNRAFLNNPNLDKELTR